MAHRDPTQPLATASILLVDDRPHNLLALEAVLEPLGQPLVRALSGEEALTRLEERDFAVVLMDVAMPGIDGIETAARMRAQPRTRSTPIIFLTAHISPPAEIARAYAEGSAVDFVVKPFDIVILRSKVSVFVELFLAREQARQLAAEQARLALAEDERRRLHRFLTQAPVAIGVLREPEHLIDFVNPRLCAMMQMSADEMIGRCVEVAFPHLRGGALLQILDRVAATGEPFVANELPTPFARRDQRIEEAFFNFNLHPMRDESGRVTSIMGVAVDVTEQVLARKRTEEAVQARDFFIATATHELRSPLTALNLQITSLLHRADELPAAVAEKLQRSRRQIGRLDTLIADLVEATRLSSGRIELDRDAVDLAELARAVVDRLAEEIANAGAPVTVDAPAPVIVDADAFRIDQVVTNLLSNALKYGNRQPIVIRVRQEQGGVISVSDRGPGIREIDRERIFERFERAPSQRSIGGLGLGLWIVRRIVEAHGGTIQLASTLGEGSTFTVTLPAR